MSIPGSAARVIAVILILSSACIGWLAGRHHAGTATAVQTNRSPAPHDNSQASAAALPPGLTIASARPEVVISTLKAAGTVSIPPSQTATVSPRVQGQVVEVLANVGDHVRAGQVLARIRSLDIAGGQAAYRQAQMQVRYAGLALQHQQQLARLGSFTQKPLEDARSAVTQAQASLMNDQSSLQQDLLGIQQDQSSVLQDQSLQHQDEADQEHDRQIADREKRLFDEGLHALQDYETAQNTSRKDEEKVRADREKIDADQLKVQADQAKVVGDQSRVKQDENQVKINQEALERERKAFGANVYAAQAIEQAESAYHAAQQQLEQASDTLRIHGVAPGGATGLVDVQAPISGVVTARNANPGMNVDTSTQTPWQMFSISNIDRVDIDLSLYDHDVSEVRVGLPVRVQSPAIPAVTYTGAISYIAPSMDPQAHAVKVKCEIANPRHLLKDGMYVDAWITTAPNQTSVFIPSKSVQRDSGGSFVYLPKPGGGFERRTVIEGRESGSQTQIVRGLTPGERVVADGAILLGGGAGSGDD